MKLKKSSILLIVIAIFLLISIGSACASENVTDTNEIELADDSDIEVEDGGDNVLLSDDTDTVENVPDDTQEKVNTTIETENDTYKFSHDADKKVSVQVKANNSNIDINKTDLAILEGNKTIAFDYNNTIVTIKDTLSVGNHTLAINYLGNENYVNSTKIITMQVYGNNTIETETSVVCNGKNIEIPVKVHDGVDYIELVKDNFNLTLVYTNENGNISNLTIKNFTVEDGKIKFDTTMDYLVAASLIIDYANATEPKTVSIKVSTEVKAEADKDKYESEEIKNISITLQDGQGNLINISQNDLEVFENGNAVEFTYNNSKITITSISEGAHNLTIVYKGNDIYNASSDNVELKVYGDNQITVPEYVVSEGSTIEVPITIFNGLENVTINKDNLTVNLTYTNAAGNVTTISPDFELNDGQIKINVNGFNLTKASLTVDYINSTGAKIVKINLNSQVTAVSDNPKYRFNETNNITVNVYDNNGQELNIVKNDLRVFDNGNEITQFTYNNTKLNVALEIGVHNLTIVYKGDETFNSSSCTIEVKVYGPVRFDPSENAALDDANVVTITVNLNDGADPVDIDANKLSATLFYTVGNQTFNRTVDSIDIDGQNIKFTVNEDFEIAYATIKYSENNLTANTNIQVNTVISASDLQVGESEVKNMTITVAGTNGHEINITKDNIKVFNNGTALTIEVNNSVVTIKDSLKFGVYNLTVQYIGNNTFLSSNKTVTLTVYGINVTTSTNINSTKIGEIDLKIISGNETVNINKEDLTLNVTYKNGNDTVVINITDYSYENGILRFTLENGTFTTAVMNIKYNNTEANVTLNRIYNAKIEIITNVNEFQTGNFTFRLVDLDDGSNITGKSVKLSNVGNIKVVSSATTDANGIAKFRTTSLYNFDQSGGTLSGESLQVGTYAYEVETEGNVKATKVSTNLTIVPANVKITIDPYSEYYGSTKNVMIHVVTSENEPLSNTVIRLTIDNVGTYYMYTNGSGIAQISLYNSESKKGLVGGDYKFTAYNNDTKNIVNTSAKATVTIKKIPVKITAKDVTVLYNSYSYTITVKKSGKAVNGMYLLVRIYSTSKKYNDYLFQTNKKGTVSFGAPLAVGKHKIIISSADNRYSASKVTKTITVKKANGKIKVPKKFTDYHKATKTFNVKMVNSKNKKAMYFTKVAVKIFVSKTRYYSAEGQTAQDGYYRLSLSNLKVGTYKVEVTCTDKNVNAKKVTSKIVIKKPTPAKLTAKKMTAKKGAKKYFKVKVTNKKTKKVMKGVKVKVKVYTGKKYKTYKVKTNKKGIAKISTKKLKVGKHKVVVTRGTNAIKAKSVKSTIKIKK